MQTRNYECKMCGHKWESKRETPPRFCPKCTSTAWATGRKRPPIAVQRARAQAVRALAEDPFRVPVLGLICAGDGFDVTPMEPGLDAKVNDPKYVTNECYALIVSGDSMTSPVGQSIPNAAKVLFCPGAERANGSIAHIEWDEGGERKCVLRKIFRAPWSDDVTLTALAPGVPDIIKLASDIEIKGIYKATL